MQFLAVGSCHAFSVSTNFSIAEILFVDKYAENVAFLMHYIILTLWFGILFLPLL